MHSLLKRQIKKLFGDEMTLPGNLQAFIAAVNEAYEQNDIDRALLERSLEISSEEMREAYATLQSLHVELENRIQERTAELFAANKILQAEIAERKQMETMQDVVYRIAQAAEEIQSLSDLYPKIHRIISDVMPARNFYIALYDGERDELDFVYYVDEADNTQPGKIRTGRGMSAYVLRTGKSLLCDQTVYAELERQGEAELLGPPSPVWLGVPLILHGRTIGVMAVQHYSEEDAYGPDEQRILEFVSSQVARAIERKRAEEELRARETRYSALVANSVDNVSLTTADGKLLYQNKTAIRPLGYREGTFSVLRLGELVHPDDLPKAQQGLKELLDSPGIPHSWELRLRHAGGSWHWIEGTATNMLHEPAIGALVFNYRDVTERKQSQAALNRQNRILSALYEITPVLMSRLGLDDVLQTIVTQAARLADTPDGYLYLTEPGGMELKLKAGLGIFEQYKDSCLERGEGVAGRILQSGQTLAIEDYCVWDQRSRKFDHVMLHAVAGVPLTSNGKVLGVIGLSHRKREQRFSEEDVELLTRFAQLASIALENANLHSLVQLELTARHQAESNLRTLTDNMLDVITQIDAEGVIRYASPSHQRVLGLNADEMIGHFIFERLHPDDIEDAMLVFSQALANGKAPGVISFRYQHADGNYMWMECVGNVLTDSEGQFAGAVLSSRDITERKQMETALRNSERRYRLLADNASDIIWIRDMSLQLTYSSPAVKKLLGFTVEEAMTQPLDHFLTPESIIRAQEFFAEALRFAGTLPPEQLAKEYRSLELEMIRKDGSTVWTESQMSFLLDEHGQPAGIIGVTRDIAERRKAAAELLRLNAELEERVKVRTSELVAEILERKRAESALRESEERYALAVRGANDGLWDWDLKTNQIYYSPRWKSMLGYQEEQIESNVNEWFRRVHPHDLGQLQSAIAGHLRGETAHFESEYRMLTSKNKYSWMLSRGLAVRDANRNAYRMAGSQTDITKRKQAEERLAHEALHDALTGLPNRTLFMDRLGQRLEHTKRHPEDLFALLFIDLDRFKVINDSLGHAVGDQFLIATAHRLQGCLRPEDTISRLGGDEFAILLDDVSAVADTVRVAERIQTRLMSTTVLSSVGRASTASIGITMFNHRYTEPHEMLRDADSAMYRAKALGGGRYQVFDTAIYTNALATLQLEADLKHAVERQEWEVYYQPVVSLTSGKITGTEALLRWMHPTRGIVSPLEFITTAEETGRILPIGEYVLRTACQQAKILRESGHAGLWVSVNISARQFQDQNLLKMIEQVLRESGLSPDGLRLEVTESVAMKDLTHSVKVLKNLEKLGIHVSLDDFGNGYSSLGYLKSFPLKVLKIDRSFIQDIRVNKNSEAIITAIISLAHTLNLQVVAEGVETQEQLSFLKSQACDEVQGYLFSKPLPFQEFDEYLNQEHTLLAVR